MDDIRASSSPDLQQQSQLLALPLELRNQIYELVFQACERTASGKVILPLTVRRRKHSVIAILKTCRQIPNEAQGLFYCLNHFWISDIRGHMLERLASLGRQPPIRTLTVEILRLESIALILKSAAKVPRLRALCFEVYGYDNSRTFWDGDDLKREWYFIRKRLLALAHVETLDVYASQGASQTLVADVAIVQQKILDARVLHLKQTQGTQGK